MDWQRAFSAYDDGALEALANAGLLRRAAKDVEAGKVQWVDAGAAAGKVITDGQCVELDARGPQHTRCNCPAPGLCKHILAAIVWLRELPASSEIADDEVAGGADSLPAESGSAYMVPPDPLAEVLALESASLFKAAGVAATREAARMVLGTQTIGMEWRVQGASLVMDLAELGLSCRWIAGAGFAGMASDIPVNQRKSIHLIALAALRLALNQPLSWPKELQPMACAEAAGLAASELAFLEQVRSTISELLCTGLSHASSLVTARLLALNMSARSEGMPRLGAMLRNLGGMLELLVQRDHQAQEADAFALICSIEALCLAMQADANVAQLAALRGRLRRVFDSADTLELLPVGAQWWQTLGGARGLSISFWDVSGARLLQATLARPDASDAAFTRQSAWSTQSLWPGMGSAEQICAGPLTLSAPRLADDDRLALGGASKAQSSALWPGNDSRLQAIGYGDWQQVSEQLRSTIGLAGNLGETMLLRPASTGALILNEAAQQLLWALFDLHGRSLDLMLPLGGQGAQGAQNAQRSQNLNRFVARKAPVIAVLVRVQQSHAQTQLLPIAALSTNGKNQLQLVSFDFASEAAVPTPLTERILRLLNLRKQQAAAVLAPKLAERLLQPIFDVLETQAATGRMRLTQLQRDQLEGQTAAIASVGLHSIVVALKAHIDASTPSTLMRLQRLSLWVLALQGLPDT